LQNDSAGRRPSTANSARGSERRSGANCGWSIWTLNSSCAAGAES
jgi:hypothetical protein